jgi:hypothetical protein
MSAASELIAAKRIWFSLRNWLSVVIRFSPGVGFEVRDQKSRMARVNAWNRPLHRMRNAEIFREGANFAKCRLRFAFHID